MTASATQAKDKAPRRAAAKPKRSGVQKREDRTGWAFIAPFAVLSTFMFILPIIWATYSSFFRQVTEGGDAYGGDELANKFVGLQNFQYAITSSDFRSGIDRVLVYTLIQMPIMIIAALALTIVIDPFVVKYVTSFRLDCFPPYAIPGVVTSIIWVYLYNGQISPIIRGLATIGINMNFFNKDIVPGSMTSITTWTFTGYSMLIFLAALQAIPHDLYEAARVGGANGWQIVTKIKLSNVHSAALLTMLLSIVGTIQLFSEPQIMSTVGPGISKSYTPMMMTMSTSRGTITPSDNGPASAIVIVMALVAGMPAVLYTLAERRVNE